LVEAVLDANVLLPAALRDTLLRAADAGLYQVRWSDDILAEVKRNLVGDWKLAEEQAERLMGVMREAFPDALVTGYATLIDGMPNHPKDRHVLAAAVACRATVIVTQNLRDFPSDALEPFNVQVQSADAFFVEVIRACRRYLGAGRPGTGA
jgi:predicted nucleic acid-binding protein